MNKTLCTTCNKFITNNNFKKHFSSCQGIKIKKIRGIDYDPNFGYTNKSRTAWNKGLTADTDERVAAHAKSQEGKLVTGCFAMSKDERSALAKEYNFGGYRENAGRSKKFKTIDSFGNDVCLQSSYELLCSEILNRLDIKWVRYLDYRSLR